VFSAGAQAVRLGRYYRSLLPADTGKHTAAMGTMPEGSSYYWRAAKWNPHRSCEPPESLLPVQSAGDNVPLTRLGSATSDPSPRASRTDQWREPDRGTRRRPRRKADDRSEGNPRLTRSPSAPIPGSSTAASHACRTRTRYYGGRSGSSCRREISGWHPVHRQVGLTQPGG
jgi:hypothetical protein